MIKKKILIAALVFACVLGLNSAWAGGSRQGTGSTSGGTMQLTIWTLANRQPGLDPVIEAWNAANPSIQVKAAYYDTDGMKDASKVAASSRTLPDMWFNWGGNLGGFYAENDLVYNLTDYAKSHNWADTFDAGVLNLCTLYGKLAGYPTSYNALVMYYRKDIFAKYNLQIPTTFEQFEELCATLKGNGIIPVSAAGLKGWHVMRVLEQFIEHYAGPSLHDKLSTFQESHDNDAVVKALAKYKEFCDKGYFPEGFLTADPNGTYIDVFAGRAAMDIQGQWYDGYFEREKQDPSLYSFFVFPNNQGNRISAFAEMTQFNANLTPEKLDACVKFMDFYTSIENYQKYPAYIKMPPKKGVPMPQDQINVPLIFDAANTNGTFTITDQAFPTEVADALFNVQDALALGQITPKEGAQRIQAAIDAYRRK
jgi:raffinose/stachyose/melibiose transport system substrate-binding protein